MKIDLWYHVFFIHKFISIDEKSLNRSTKQNPKSKKAKCISKESNPSFIRFFTIKNIDFFSTLFMICVRQRHI